jgi:hypothetical protein
MKKRPAMQKEEEVEGTSQGYSWPAKKKAVSHR